MMETEARLDYGRIRLLPAGPEHLAAWKSFMQDPEVMRYIFGGWNPGDPELSDLLARNVHLWTRHHHGWWSVVERESGEIIANCVLDVSCTGPSEIGYIIRRDSWRKGFGTEIVKCLCSYAFGHDHIAAVKAYVNVDNLGSIRILEQLGFARVSDAVFSGRPCINFGLNRERYAQIAGAVAP